MFYISSIHFMKFKKKVEEEKVEAMTKASNYVFSETASVANYGHFYPKRNSSSITNEYEFKTGTEFTVVKSKPARPVAFSVGVKKGRPILTNSSKRFESSMQSITKAESVN